MNIGVIGAGNIGGALVRLLRAADYDVAVANSRGPTSLSNLASETGARPVTVESAARENDVVVVTIPLHRIPELPSNLFAGARRDVIVVDTSNYYPRERDGRIDEIESGMPESGWVANRLGVPVIKAFNSIYAQHLLERAKPNGAPGRVALAVAGDDAGSKTVVMSLIDDIGFDTVDAGPISESWRQQPGSPGYLNDFDKDGVRRALSDARNERTSQWRATAHSPGTFESPR